MPLTAKVADLSWDYETADTKQDTHCYHNYPAMMIPQIASRLIEEYGSFKNNLLDPYCGTGTSLVEASINGISAHGTDINPMARLIAETKTLKIELDILDSYLEEFKEFVFSLSLGVTEINPVTPNFPNIDFWFKKSTIEKLAAVKSFIKNIKDERVRKFFMVAFSETVRDCSLSRNSEFKLYRMPSKKMDTFDPDVFSIITMKLVRNRRGLKSYLSKIGERDIDVNIYDFNSSISIDLIPKQSIDLVVTSPPYGDSKTTVAYGQFSRLSNQWLDVQDARTVDNRLMGGKPAPIEKTGISHVDQSVEKVRRYDEKRAQEVFSFYSDYRKSINNVATTIKKGGYACYVVGNRRVKNIVLQTDEITKKLFEQNGFCHLVTHIRNIPKKRMPAKNSPTNEAGKTATTMNYEYIVIMQKT